MQTDSGGAWSDMQTKMSSGAACRVDYLSRETVGSALNLTDMSVID